MSVRRLPLSASSIRCSAGRVSAVGNSTAARRSLCQAPAGQLVTWGRARVRSASMEHAAARCHKASAGAGCSQFKQRQPTWPSGQDRPSPRHPPTRRPLSSSISVAMRPPSPSHPRPPAPPPCADTDTPCPPLTHTVTLVQHLSCDAPLQPAHPLEAQQQPLHQRQGHAELLADAARPARLGARAALHGVMGSGGGGAGWRGWAGGAGGPVVPSPGREARKAWTQDTAPLLDTRILLDMHMATL